MMSRQFNEWLKANPDLKHLQLPDLPPRTSAAPRGGSVIPVSAEQAAVADTLKLGGEPSTAVVEEFDQRAAVTCSKVMKEE